MSLASLKGPTNGGALKLHRGKLIRAREMLGYGVEKTAEVAGISKNSVLRAEHEADIRPVTARKIAGALGVRVADLLGDADAKKAPAPLSPEWALSTPDEAFRRGVEAAPTEELRGLIVELVAGEHPRLFEDERAEKPPADVLYKRSVRFARGLIVREELLRRGEEAPERRLLALRRYMNALELADDPALGRYRAEELFPPEQVAAFLAQDERDNERIKREVAKLDPEEMQALVDASPALRKIRNAYLQAATEEQKAHPEAG
jgi:transcriptional regulator with XRE-family HTH domain